MEETKTKDYKLRAQKNYMNKFEVKNIRLPKGTTERIKKTGENSINSFVVSATLEKLERLEQESGTGDEYPF